MNVGATDRQHLLLLAESLDAAQEFHRLILAAAHEGRSGAEELGEDAAPFRALALDPFRGAVGDVDEPRSLAR
ncbi:hypothetical protein D3C83_239940 [compost metagenome]